MALTPEEAERLNQIFEAALKEPSGNRTPSDSSIGSLSSHDSIDKYFPSSMSVQSKATSSAAPSKGILKTLSSFQGSGPSKAYITQSQASGTQYAKNTRSETSTDSMTTAPLPVYITPKEDFNFDPEKDTEEGETQWQLGYVAINRDALNVEISGPCAGRATYSGFFIPISPKLPDPIKKIVDNLKKTSIVNILDIEETYGEINKKIAFDMLMNNKVQLQFTEDDAVIQLFKEQFAEKLKLEVSKRKLKKKQIKRLNEIIVDKLGEEFVITVKDMNSRFRKFMKRIFPCFFSTDSD